MINLGLIGYPLESSYSPIIHKTALAYCNLSGDYSLFPVSPDDNKLLKHILNRVRRAELTGLNVTIPYKQKVIPLLDELTPTAKAIGAVNTISMQNGKLTGTNTDAAGFSADLRKFLAGLNRNKEVDLNALVLGGGGSARAVTHTLVNQGWNVTFATRRPQNAHDFLSRSSNQEINISNIELKAKTIRSLNFPLHLIINATPVGMSPQIEYSPWPTGLTYPRAAVFYDLVYNPRETKFALDARAAGLLAITGLGMLVEQAALAFELWTGCVVPRDYLFAAVEDI
ncbi:MAG: shikimate dehydrogenase [Anaerolineales bacterium]